MAIITHYLQSGLTLLSSMMSAPLLLDTSFALCLILALLMGLNTLRQTLKLPPGPKGFPILGILPLIKKEFHLMLFDYSKTFGKILSFKMGKETFVVLSDYNMIKKAFQSRDFVARPKSEMSQLLGGYGKVPFSLSLSLAPCFIDLLWMIFSQT